MIISGYREYFVKLPPRRTHNWASNMKIPIGQHYILSLETDDGILGWGEAPALATWGGPYGMYYGEDSATISHVVRTYLFPAIEGKDPTQIKSLHQKMNKVIKGHPYAKSAIDIALHDLAGKATEMPVHQLLGGKLRDSIPLCHSLGIMENSPAIDEAEEAVSEGVQTIKCKTGLEPERDIDLVKRLRERLGPDITIRVDANEAYVTPDQAIQVAKAMDPFQVVFQEQPVPGFKALAEVARAIKAPVMADESCWFPQDVLRLSELGAAEIISLYVTKPGGLYPAMQVASTAKKYNMTCDIGGSIEMGIGVAANLHLGTSIDILKWASVCPLPNVNGEAPVKIAGIYYQDDIIKTPIHYENGNLFVPNGPGLGIEVDEEKLLKYAL